MTVLENGLNRLTGNPFKVVLVPQDNWPEIRKEYLQNHAVSGHNNEDQPTTTEKAPAPEVSEVVQQAQALFGDAVVVQKD